MKRSGLISVVMVTLLLAAAAEAGPKDSKGNGHFTTVNCPPGLAKKNPPCIPPGQVGKQVPLVPIVPLDRDDLAGVPYYDNYAVGAPLPDDYVVMFDPLLYPYWPHATYARYGDYLYLIDPVTGLILNPASPVTDWNWQWSGVDFTHCPPGLAKKNPPCVPPGQAKKGVIIDQGPYAVGDHLPDGYRMITDPALPAGVTDPLYVRLGDSLYSMDRETGLVLQLIGTIADLLH